MWDLRSLRTWGLGSSQSRRWGSRFVSALSTAAVLDDVGLPVELQQRVLRRAGVLFEPDVA